MEKELFERFNFITNVDDPTVYSPFDCLTRSAINHRLQKTHNCITFYLLEQEELLNKLLTKEELFDFLLTQMLLVTGEPNKIRQRAISLLGWIPSFSNDILNFKFFNKLSILILQSGGMREKPSSLLSFVKKCCVKIASRE